MYKLYSGITAALKRAAVMIPALCISIQLFVFSVAAESGDTVITVSGAQGYDESVTHGGATYTPEVTYVSGTIPYTYKYQWFVRRDPSKEWSEEPWETSSKFTIGNYDAKASINVRVTPVDENGNPTGPSVETNTENKSYFAHSWMLGVCNEPWQTYSYITEDTVSKYQNTPEEYLFEVDGVKFILLDAHAMLFV